MFFRGLAGVLFVTFQAIYSLLLIDMFLIIILRSYKDVRNSGADDPIAVEIRKLVVSTIRIWRSIFAGFFLSLIPSRISPCSQDDEEIEFDKMQINSRARFSELTKEEYQRQVVLLAQNFDVLSGEIQYLTERLSDVTKTQQELLKIHLSLECNETTDGYTSTDNQVHVYGVVHSSRECRGEDDFVYGVSRGYSDLMSRWIKAV